MDRYTAADEAGPQQGLAAWCRFHRREPRQFNVVWTYISGQHNYASTPVSVLGQAHMFSHTAGF